ncbi:MAG: non-homologous end-joining DNA ligase [Acidobacteria bacterium]|nr:non-homologous end-joining DNA ligase [Acidobacteriota bacterium]
MTMKWREDPAGVRPMLATLADPPLSGARLVYEPKYDGIRALIDVPPSRDRDRGPGVRVWSRLGNEKTFQFPSVVRALERFAAKLRGPLLLDGEIVALDDRGRPSGFQRLQGRIHLTGAQDVARLDLRQPVAFIAFDLLRDGDEDIRGLSLTDRRARLVTRLTPSADDTIRISEQAIADGHGLEARARDEGWEGLIVKDAQSPYQSGRRSPAWRKKKMVRQEEFVVGGWTEPRQSRHHFGALLLGVFDSPGQLTYVGHTGTGFDQAELERIWKLLQSRETDRSPFASRFKTNEPAHWVRPDLVAQVRFTEWTDDQKLRHPVYLGLRDDKRAAEVRRERSARRNTNHEDTEGTEDMVAEKNSASSAKKKSTPRPPRLRGDDFSVSSASSVISALRALEDARRDGTIELPDGLRLGVTNLHKVFWPRHGLTKGDLLRYYANPARRRLRGARSRPWGRDPFRSRAGCRAVGEGRTRVPWCAGRPQDLGFERTARLHPAPSRDVI